MSERFRNELEADPAVTGIATPARASLLCKRLARQYVGTPFVVWDRAHNGDYTVFSRRYFNYLRDNSTYLRYAFAEGSILDTHAYQPA